MDEIVPASPPRNEIEIVDAPLRVETPRDEDGQISIDVKAPGREEMQREDPQISSTVDTAPSLPLLARMSIICKEFLDELRLKQTYVDCLDTCVFFFFCHALTSVLLSITICCRCYTSMLKMPDRMEKRTAHTHKVFAFFAKNLSALWASSLLILFARWVLFRPLDVKPRLGASAVHEFELQSPGGTHPHLRFNATTFVLFHNGHKFYKIRYHYFAASFLYADVNLGRADDGELPSFRQKPHESTLERLPFVGLLRNASGAVEETFARERAEGQLQMLVRIRVSLNYGFWPFKGDYFTMYDCPLHSPFPQMGEPAFSSPAWCDNLHV